MGIPNQQHINVGLPNESQNSDSLYTAFNKINDNFDTLFANATQLSAGNGIVISNAYPQVVSANITAGNNITVAVVNSAIQINAVVERYASNSNSNLTLSLTPATKSLSVGTGLSYTPGQIIVVANTATDYMTGPVSSYNANTGALTFVASNIYGNANTWYTSWSINLTGASAGGTGLYGVLPGNGILINGSNSNGAYESNATISLSSTGVIAGNYTAPVLTIDATGRITNASNANSIGTVTSVAIANGVGIGVAGGPITSNQVITITNTGVTRLNAGAGIVLSGTTGNITISGPSSLGTVTFANLTSNSLLVTGGPITTIGTINVELPSNITITGNLTAGNVKTDNLLYANGSPWDMQQPQGPNTAVQFNDSDSFGGTSNYTFDKSTNNLNVTGNIIVSTGAFFGNGAGLTNITGANVTGTVANATYAANAGNATNATTATTATTAGSATTAGTVTTAAQPNITSVGTLTGLTVSGTSNLGAVGNVTITGGTPGYYLQTNGSGGLSWAAIPSGNGIANGTSNITIPTSAGNVVVYVSGNNTANITGTGVNVSGTLNATGNANVGNIGAANGVYTANITAANIYANTGIIGAQNLKGEGGNISNIQGANVSGTVGSATTAGTVTTAAQPNITSVGTLSSLSVTNNATANTIVANTYMKTVAVTFATLPTAATAGAGARAFITDGNVAIAGNVGNQISGGGSNSLPVYSDGTNWRIG